ncbi:DUF3293 domain-containing protein [Lysobacter sp. SG-8]|uniref:DUF3293 domain-containing protein n=1 Tax=Marilutibacter penaei TaxID=2759900 RepID=A0A7W3U282_9GAMM|nr:DUF3293 domain-containing protein [Lysobacter penaei]MBB1087549.1 DUF3293 domain-containing protein [Lysobacter penaei]
MQEFQVVDAAELAAAFVAARYVVRVDGDAIALEVGAPAVDLEAYCANRSYGYITAWNPASRPVPGTANAEASARLRARLESFDLELHPATSSDASGQWIEEGWLAAGIDRDVLDTLAVEFGQAGVLFWEHGEPVRLRMSVAAPDGAPDLPCVDWDCGRHWPGED